jgi:WD40 repeat protein
MRARLTMTVTVVLTAAAVVAPPASADIIAATTVDNPSSGLDIALIDTATGAHLSLPAGVDTTANELHPSITPDGKRLVFERTDNNGTDRIIAADLTTGQQVDLFDAFEAGELQPGTPTITPDGQTVITGAKSTPSGSSFVPTWVETSLANFPNGPFTHTVRQIPFLALSDDGHSFDPAFDPSLGVHGLTVFTLQRDHSPPVPDLDFVSDSGKIKVVSDNASSLLAPAISGADGILLFERFGSTDPFTADLVYRTLASTGAVGGTTFSLPGVNSPDTENLQPAFAPGGKYIGYLHRSTNPGLDNLSIRLYDTSTQMLLDPDGVNLRNAGSVGTQNVEGGLSLYDRLILRSSSLLSGAVPSVVFTLAGSSGVGILVQRIVGHHRLFGHRAFKLRTVGRVPFGRFHGGKHRVRWNLRVDGHRLRRGRYLITPRALTRAGVVRELGRSHVLHLR